MHARVQDFDKTMGGHGSGKRPDDQRRRLVERSFALDVSDLQVEGFEPGTEGLVRIRAPLIAWPLTGHYLIWNPGERVVTFWFDIGFNVDVRVDVPQPGSHRRTYFRCPRPEHQAGAGTLSARLYWPPFDPKGFACRACHKLAYRSSQARHERPLWLQHLAAEVRAPHSTSPSL